MTTTLSTHLREGTKESHAKAERSAFLKQLFKGTLDRRTYGKFVVSLYHIYCALEGELDRHKGDPLLSTIDFPALRRKAELERDLAFYLGPNWEARATLSPATRLYMQRIREVSAMAPVLLVAHCYTRYLGDLSGGQILKRIVQRSMNLRDEAGIHFYVFKDIPDEKAFKDDFRKRLDELPIDETMVARIVDEANAAFHLNIATMQELEGDLFETPERSVASPH